MQLLLTVAFLLATPAATAGNEVLKSKVEAEGKVAADDFAKYAKWCDDEAGEKERSIADSKAEIEDLSATIADAQGTITTLETKIGDLTTTISQTEQELADAKANRNEGHTTFVSAENELVDTVDTLGHDATLIKEKMGFLQGAKMPAQTADKIQRMLTGLKSIVDSQWATTQDKAKVQAFLQEKAQEDDSDMQAPAAYESKSGGILETIGDMEGKAEDSLGSERKEEMKDQNSFEMLKMALTNEIKNLKDELSKATSQKQFSTQELEAANKALASNQKSLSEDQAYLRDLKMTCQTKAGEYEEEYTDRENELGALGKAKAIMSEKFSFIQTSVSTRSMMKSKMLAGNVDDRKQQALALIHRLGKKLGSTVLVSLSYRALADPFAKVRNMIEEMISKLLQEASEEAEQKGFCDKELGETNASKDEKEQRMNTLDSRIEKSMSASAKLEQQVKQVSKELAEIDKAMAEATAIRTEEKATFQTAEKEYSESQEACAAAIEVLRSYYESGSFVQVSSTTRSMSKAKMHARAKARATEEGDGGGIIGMLEVAESDFSKLLSEARAVEGQAVDEFEKMTTENKVLKATKTAEVKSKRTEIASLGSTLSQYGEDKDGLTKELSAVMEYLDKLKPQCEYEVPSYEERKQRREKEIDGLKEALAVLEGDGI